jgi:hypothetical protein
VLPERFEVVSVRKECICARSRMMQTHLCAGVQCVQICDPWLVNAVLELGTKRPDLIDKPRGWPLPIYDCFDRVRCPSTSNDSK